MDPFFNNLCRKFKNFLFEVHPFWIHLIYFVIISLLGLLALTISNPKNTSVTLNRLDVFFTSVSAVAVSSMSTIEMEVFSNVQLIIMIFLMFFGGEIFTSMLYLQLKKFKLIQNQENTIQSNESSNGFPTTPNSIGNVELPITSNGFSPTRNSIDIVELKTISNGFSTTPNSIDEHPINRNNGENIEANEIEANNSEDELRLNSIKILTFLILGYLFAIIVIGSICIFIYMILVPSAGDVLKKKGLNLPIFSIFSTVSTFTNCGFIPTNENMIVFKKNSGFLLILIPQLLSGNTMYPVFLFLIILFFNKIKRKEEFSYMLRYPGELEYGPLFPGRKAFWLAVTVFLFLLVQFVMFCSFEWKSEATVGLTSYEKLVGFLFEVVNSRHAGESVFDLSLVTPAILVLITMMMYFPPFTLFSPRIDGEDNDESRAWTLIEFFFFSQLSYLVIFIIAICITEKDRIKEDPLNFNVLNIVFEVISAYGNVGFSIGYSCARQIKPDGHCKDAWFGFVGRWSNKGKIILIVVMFFGRVKNFSRKGGRAWKLS